MNVHLLYGAEGIDIDLDADLDINTKRVTLVRAKELEGLDDEATAVRYALRNPIYGPSISELVLGLKETDTRSQQVSIGADYDVVVVFPDLTRPMPNKTVLPPILAELEQLGLGPDRVLLLCATGSHRCATTKEMIELVGEDIFSRYAIHDHRSSDGEHVEVGRVEGHPVLLDRRYCAARIRIVTGFVEPHFFAGFSGGPKAVCPGLSADETILEAHSPARIGSPNATWLKCVNNPVHDYIRAAVALAPPSMSLDVAINDDRKLLGVFCGSLPRAHEEACAFVERSCVQRVEGKFDVVVTTNGGYPLDRNLYQCVKGLAAAERVVRDGGTIIMAAQCCDGLPANGSFARILLGARSVEDLVSKPSHLELDRWQVQILGRVLTRAKVMLYSEGLSRDEICAAHLIPLELGKSNLEKAVNLALASAGPGSRLCVLEQGPLTVAVSG